MSEKTLPPSKWIVVAAVALVALLAVFPPYDRIYHAEGVKHVYAGHAPVFAPPDPIGPRGGTPTNWAGFPSVEIDFSRLLLEWVGVAGLTGVALLLLPMITARRPRSSPEQSQSAEVVPASVAR